MTPPPMFGANIDPAATGWQLALDTAQLADRRGLDLVMSQDHPYNRRHFDTWTLLTALAMQTGRVHIGTNVANLPLRPPAMLAKAAATLDVLTGGRVELGLGAGAYWQGVAALGGETRTPGEAYAAFEDALHILKGLWANAGRSFTYEGQVYRIKGAQFGPAPTHPIRVWAGASGPRILRLTGRMADGIIVSSPYALPPRLLENNQLIDEGAQEAGRSPDEIRRAYNLMGIIQLQPNAPRPAGLQPGTLYGTPREWIDQLTEFYTTYRQDTFVLWPLGDNPVAQFEAFADEIAPGVREALATRA